MYTTINGWTKAKMIERIREKVPIMGSQTIKGRCAYRSGENKACAAGAFIPDGHPSLLHMEGMRIGAVIEAFPDLASFMPIEDMHYLQKSHDVAVNNFSCKNVMEEVLDWVNKNVKDPA